MVIVPNGVCACALLALLLILDSMALKKRGPPTRSELSELTLEVRGIRKDLDATRVELGQRIDAVEGAVERNTGVLKQILKAVSVGNERRDERVTELEHRVEKLEQHTGLAPAE